MGKYNHEEILEGLEKDIRPYEGPGNVEFVDVTEDFKNSIIAGTRIWLCKQIKPKEIIGRIGFNENNGKYEFYQRARKSTGSGEMLDIAEFLGDIEMKLSAHEDKIAWRKREEFLRKSYGDQAGK